MGFVRSLLDARAAVVRLSVASTLAFCAVFAGFHAAQAQTVLAPLPQDALLDPNGVDLASGQFNHVSAELTIGDPAKGGLVYERQYGTGATRSNWDVVEYSAYWSIDGISRTSWGVGDRSYSFTRPSGTPPPSPNPTGLVSVYDSVARVFTVTAPDGTVYKVKSLDPLAVKNAPDRQLEEIRKPNGEIITLTYKTGAFLAPDPARPQFTRSWTTRRLTSVTNNYGYQLKFEYERDNQSDTGSLPGPIDNYITWSHVVKVTGINSAFDYCSPTADHCTGLTQAWPSVTYSNFNPSTITKTDALGAQTQYGGGVGSMLVAVRNPTTPSGSWDLRVTHVGYDMSHDGVADTNVVSQVVTQAGTWGYSYSDTPTTRTVTVTDPLSRQRVYTSQISSGRLLSYINELGQTAAYQYDAYGRLIRVTQPEGSYEQYTYDVRGNITEKRLVAKPGSGLADLVSSASYPSTCLNPVTCNKPTALSDPRGSVTDYVYDAVHGGLLTETAPAGQNSIRPETRYGYGALSARYKNSATTYQYGAAVQKLISTSTCATQAACAGVADEVKTAYAYAHDNLFSTSTTTGAGDSSLSATTVRTYDAVGNLTSVDGPLAGPEDTTYYRYDTVRRRVGEIAPDPDGAGALKRQAVRTTYDLNGRVTAVDSGTVLGFSDGDWGGFVPLQNVAYQYDARGRKVRETTGAGGVAFYVAQFAYDARDRLTCAARRMNSAAFGTLPASACDLGPTGADGPDRVAVNSYDAAGRISQVTAGLGTPLVQKVRSFTYTANGREATVSDANGSLTTYGYDGFDRLKTTRYPDAANGAVSSATDYEQLTYDASSNIVQRRLRDGQIVSYGHDALDRLVADLDGTTYAYDNLGRRLSATRPGGVISYSWDALGRNVGETSSLGTIGREFDLAGRPTRLTWPDGFYVSWLYDAAGRVKQVKENGAAQLVAYTYDDLGRRVQLARANGASTAYGYDPVSQLTSLVHDLAGTADDVTYAYGYSAGGQLIARTTSNLAYDGPAPVPVARNSSPNGLNQIVASGPLSLSYDGRGNLTSDGANGYGYDIANRLTSKGTVAVSYDPAGRLAQVTGSSTIRLLYDGTSVIGEYDGGGALLRRYVPGPGTDESVVWYEGSGTADRRWIIADRQGSVINITDEAGIALGALSYDEYGVPAAGNYGRFQYTGQIWIPEVGLYHYKAREYSPTLGRFMQTDPIGYSDGMNLYAYVSNDPLNKVDIFGNQSAAVVATQTTQSTPPNKKSEAIARAATAQDVVTVAALSAAKAGGASDVDIAKAGKALSKTALLLNVLAEGTRVVDEWKAGKPLDEAVAGALGRTGTNQAAVIGGELMGAAALAETGPGALVGAAAGGLAGGYLAETSGLNEQGGQAAEEAWRKLKTDAKEALKSK